MEENQNPTSPIGGEPPRVGAPLVPIAENTSERNARLVNHAKQLILTCLHGDGGVDELRVALQELNEVNTDTSPLMGVRATLHHALTDWDNIGATYHNRGELMDAMSDFTAAVAAAGDQVDALLGFTNPDAGEGLTHEDFQHDPYAGDSEGEMRAEAEAERRADAAYELAAELASCDWEGWN